MSGVNDIRSGFLDFFRREGHEIVASSPLVPRNDPTLMFANSGMVQFKNLFTGQQVAPYRCATTAQKCVRAGGKHNDLDNVGYTARHLTFFEMLGNFSFGDYFKERAIDMAWRLVTREFGLAAERLYVTVYHDDEEAAGFWRRIAGLGDDRIIRIATNDNFWRMGDVGPCGPCSEIFFDHGPKVAGGPPGSAEADGDRFVEIWNLVFMQFEELPGGERVPLPRPSIDTGMGLERMATVLQGVHDIYNTDLMRALIAAVAEVTGVDADDKRGVSHRVIADHLRCSAFLVADGVLPGNEGRGYVLRRIMRRAMRHAQLLGASEPVMWRLVPALIREMGLAYPELVRASALITETLRLEETRFLKTLKRGLVLLDEATAGLTAGQSLPGDVAFKLYDTFGFPLDLTEDALKSRSITVDQTGFTTAMARQKAEARASWAGSGEATTERVWFELRERVGASEFLGYDTETAEGVVSALVVDGKEVHALNAGESGLVLFNQTPFYAESGGQLGDEGRLQGAGVRARVSGTGKILGDLFVHRVSVDTGTLSVGVALELHVDHARRAAIRAHHSSTHLLHEALRLVLGDHVAQKGSMVAPDRLRFDFSQHQPISADELRKVEDLANEVVIANTPVTTRLMAVDEAIASGARALFGEKYGEEVRVVSMGPHVQGKAWSVELCGGTHVERTGDIGVIAVIGEQAVSSGVRRIEALSGEAARRHFNEQAQMVAQAAELLKVTPSGVVERLAKIMDERRSLERELGEARRKLALGGSAGGDQDMREIAGIRFLARRVDGIKANDLKSLADEGKARLVSGVVALISVGEDGKGSVVVALTQDMTARFDAVQLVKQAAQAMGGKGGGGRRDMAQAGGPDGAQAEAAIEAVAALLGAS
ncbi:alanine--tRNA ligase [Candidatus Raskinella chloraquaticus]|uniref:Alanine--tRNA ligase n=1 Tax=Candidatus Raskinella chloraquaticus TaxID=1951219 RepID=A0A1W9I2A7_9HYPH|nr:MAG: alanine--tRNA ligase [Proteobacteria bacterium SG_bin8]